MQQTDYWLPVIFSGIAAVGGAGGGVFSAIYSASFTRRRQSANYSQANWRRCTRN
jgi:hypothetical protein